MSAHPLWRAEAVVRLGKLVLFVYKGEEPRGTVAFEDTEEEEAALCTELIQRMNDQLPLKVLSEQEKPS